MTMKYSRLETILLDLIPKRKVKISTSDLITRFYDQVEAKPYHHRAVIIGMMRSLTMKSDFNNEKWQIHKTRRSGPRDISFWRAPR